MITIDQARDNIGRGVVYRRPHCETEQGVITSVSETTVFVRYSGDMHSKGTCPADLEWLTPDKQTVSKP